MKNYKRYFKILIALSIIPCSWLFFFFFSYGVNPDDRLYIFPLIIYIIQLLLSIGFKNRKLILITFLNPVFVFAFIFALIALINYAAKKPAIIKCSYSYQKTSFDSVKLVYVQYENDDCDWEGYYMYSHNVNNFITEKLIKTFGNPILKK